MILPFPTRALIFPKSLLPTNSALIQVKRCLSDPKTSVYPFTLFSSFFFCNKKAFNIDCISPQSGLWGSMIISKSWYFPPGFSPREPTHHFQFNKPEAVNGTCAKSGQPSDLTARLKDTCIFSVYIYIKIYICTYTPYSTCTRLQIHQQRCMFRQHLHGKKGFHHFVPLTQTLLWCIKKYLFPWYQESTWKKNFLIQLYLMHTVDCFPWKKWNMILTSQGTHSSFVLAHVSRALHIWITYHLDAGENEVEHLINWLVCTGILSDPILYCWGQQDDLGKAL